MITQAEIRRLAGQWRVDPMILNLDYSLTWLLAALFASPVISAVLRFKGGTCLRKCYFAGYRFSEDLDFTAAAPLTASQLTGWIEQSIGWANGRDGPDFGAAPWRLETVADEYGQEAFQARLYFRGPLRWEGSPQAVRLDITRSERVLLPVEARPFNHVYSDATLFAASAAPCYALMEILAEKLRAVSGQRRFAISRDLYDIHQLAPSAADLAGLAALLPGKFKSRGVDLTRVGAARLESRRSEYEQDWRRRLDYLMPEREAVTFDQAWETTLALLTRLEQHLRGRAA